MDLEKTDFALLSQLLPGVVAILAFYWNLKHPVPNVASRGVIALIATELVVMAWAALKAFALEPGEQVRWASHLDVLGPVIFAILGGLVASRFMKWRDGERKKTRRTSPCSHSGPLDWQQVLRTEKSHVMLNLKDGQQVLGWPEGWPGDPTRGYFFLTRPLRLGGASSHASAPKAFAALIPASDVVGLDFLEEADFEAARRSVEIAVTIPLGRSEGVEDVCYE
ncbi:DUF6338 family protein [Roseateles aquatilis]|uniref:DUF6338 family protein n=1 Tax=Roseateles aquatilis TaxID=431061 RepID=UPI0011314E1D|nr:DUF6338 family protein [Roseateles aquatilis]